MLLWSVGFVFGRYVVVLGYEGWFFMFDDESKLRFMMGMVCCDMCVGVLTLVLYSGGGDDVNLLLPISAAPVTFFQMGLLSSNTCLLYTSDSADDLLCVNLGCCCYI